MVLLRGRQMVSLVGACLAPVAFGQETIDPMLMKHVQAVGAKVDKNSDGKMSREEFIKFAKQYAQENHGMEHEPLLQDMDENEDGKLSIAEVTQPPSEDDTKEVQEREAAHELKKFKLADANNNGYLEGEEIIAFFHPPATKEILQAEAYNTLKRWDKDGNSGVTLEEFLSADDPEFQKNAELRSQNTKYFNLLDKDGNGQLSLREIMDYETGHHMDAHAIDELFTVADANNDGHLDHDEIHGKATELTETMGHHLLMEWIGDSKDEL
eukprot:TRINITY_DN49629_c0_g3_i11.p1 TRINITY_DN49629_c0_g3~~TRINITY_DN49629_c0_g3_i11.p1  ORF type:complete len:268 (-),score=80.65 TRINITY_DN49629_c0_g3_i11:730-1533(-)